MIGLLRIAGSLVAVGCVTAGCHLVFHVNATTAGFLYLLAALVIATAWGFWHAAVVSVAAMLSFNYFFLPPIGQFTIADPQNWVALFTFLATSLVASHLSERLRGQTLDLLNRQRETEQLYALSRSILLSESGSPVVPGLVQHLAQIFDCNAVALYDSTTNEFFKGGAEEVAGIEDKLRQAVTLNDRKFDPESMLTVGVINLGGRPIGSLAMRGQALSDGALQALLNLLAIALERVRSGELAQRAEMARQREEFKSTLLDAIAHEFKTPLTSIKAASTSILSSDNGLDAQTRELTTIIDEEADRLSVLVTDAVRMSQIDAGKVRLEKRPVDSRQLLAELLAECSPRAEGRELALQLDPPLPHLEVDPELISLALRQLLENAFKYSPDGSPVRVHAAMENDRLLVRVSNQGQGIPEKELERIFDKYYRMQSSRQKTSGSGLGLHIAREIMRMHGGDLWAEPGRARGAEFCAAIPVTGMEGVE